MRIDEFLLARVAEDEASARDEGAWAMTAACWKGYLEGAYNELQSRALAMSRRVLAECAAKWRYLDEIHNIGSDGRCGACSDTYCVTPWDGVCEARKYMALVYADHPDYDEAWRP